MSNLVAEFYCNMGVGPGVNGIFYINSVINGTPILIDHLLLGRILKFSPNAMSKSPIDIASYFTFNTDELRMFLSVFCGVEVPSNVYYG